MTESEPECSFEVSLTKLDEIVRQLEEGRLPLAESLCRYEEGVRRLRECYTALKSAERKIELLVKIDATGTAVTESFEATEETLEEKQLSRGSKRSRRSGNLSTRPTPDDPSKSQSRGIDSSQGLF